MDNKPTIVYVKDGEEKLIFVNKFNKKLVWKKILKYLICEKISLLKFINYDFSDKNSYFDQLNFYNRDIELVFENCKFGVWYFNKGKYLKLVNVLGNETDTSILIENMEKVDIELSGSLDNSNIISSIYVDDVSKLDIKLKNVDLKALFINDVRETYIKGIDANTYFKAVNARNLFLKDSNIDINSNMNLNVTNLLDLNNSTINIISFNTFEFNFDSKIVLVNSNIKANKMLKISDISNILFKDLEDDSILDNSSYIETNGIIVGDKELFNSESRVIFDKNMLIDLAWNVMYVKNGVTIKKYILNDDFSYWNEEELSDIFIDNESKLLDDIELLYLRNIELNGGEIELNKNQIIILEDCYCWHNEIINGNVEIINNGEVDLNLSLVGSKDVNIIVRDKYLENVDGRIDLTGVEKITFCIKNDTIKNKISLFEVTDCVLENNYHYDSLCLKRLDCEEVRVENIDFRVTKRNNIEYKKLSLINGGICIGKFYDMPDLEYLYMSNGYICATGSISLPNLDKIVVNDGDGNISYLSSDESLLIGDKNYEKKDGLSNVRVNISPNEVNSLSSGRKLLTMKLKSISDNLNSGVLAIDQEEKNLLDELDLLEKELMEEIEEERRKIKENTLVKKHKFLVNR